MKNKLTEQKINEFLTKALTAILTKRASKTLQKLQSSDPVIKRELDNIGKAADSLRKSFEKKYGKEYTDKVLGK